MFWSITSKSCWYCTSWLYRQDILFRISSLYKCWTYYHRKYPTNDEKKVRESCRRFFAHWSKVLMCTIMFSIFCKSMSEVFEFWITFTIYKSSFFCWILISVIFKICISTIVPFILICLDLSIFCSILIISLPNMLIWKNIICGCNCFKFVIFFGHFLLILFCIRMVFLG